MEALLALDIHFVIRPDGPDREHMKLERLLWGMSRLEPADTQETPLPLPVGTPRDDVDQFVQSFFKKLERPGNGEH